MVIIIIKIIMMMMMMMTMILMIILLLHSCPMHPLVTVIQGVSQKLSLK